MHSQILTLIEFKSVPTCWILALLSKTQRRFGVGKRPSPGRTGHANVCYTDQQQHFLPNWVDSFNFIRSRATYDKHFDKFKLAALHIQQSRTLHFMIFNSCYKTSKYSSVMLSSVLLEMRWIRIRWIWFQFHWLMLLICRAGHTNALISTSLFTSPSSSSFDSPSFFIRFQWILLLMCQHHPTTLRHRDIHPECGLQCRWQRVVFILRLFSPSATENSTFFFFYFFFNMLNKNTLFNGTEN